MQNGQDLPNRAAPQVEGDAVSSNQEKSLTFDVPPVIMVSKTVGKNILFHYIIYHLICQRAERKIIFHVSPQMFSECIIFQMFVNILYL